MPKTVFETLSDKIIEKRTMLEHHVSRGKCKDWADYQLNCGQIRGLTTSLQEITDLAKNFTEDENYD